MMGRVCPAPCQDGCNRNHVEDFVGINSVEQYIGDVAYDEGFKFECPDKTSGKRVAIIGGGPAGMAGAYQLRRRGHASTVFESQEELGGMMRYGIPGYRTPRAYLDREIERILEMGDIEVRNNTKVGTDVSIEEIEKEFDAVLWAVGCQTGRKLPVPNSDAPNCISGVAFLEAFNKGHLQVTANRVICVGGGDTSIDVVSVARRLGKIPGMDDKLRAEHVVGGYVAHDSAMAAAREGADVTLTSLFPKEEMTAAEHEVHDALREGVTIRDGVMPVEVLLDDTGRARALRMAECTIEEGRPSPVEGTEFEIEADLIVSAIGQGGDLSEGLAELDNGRGLIDASKFFEVEGRPGHFVAGDIIRPHLLTTAIGQASIAAEGIDQYLKDAELRKRPKVDVHHFDLLAKLNEARAGPHALRNRRDPSGTCDSDFSVHNYEDRSSQRDHHPREAVPRPLPLPGPQPARRRRARQRGRAGPFRGTRGRPERRGGGLRGRPLHELRHVLRMRQLRRVLPAGCRVPGQEGRAYDRDATSTPTTTVHRLPYLRRRLPDRLHRHGSGRALIPG